MVYNNQRIFEPRSFGAVAVTHPWIVAMVLVGAGSVLLEVEVGAGTGVWSRVAPAYTVDSPSHCIAVEKGKSRLRITPSGGATYDVTNN